MKRFALTLLCAAHFSLFIFPFSSAVAQRPPITPAWAFGHIAWEDSLNTTAGAERIVDGYLERNIPVDAVIIDSPWSTAYNDFNWDHARYADPQAMIQGFAQKGVRTILWLTGNVNEQGKDTPLQKAATYDEVVSKGYGVNNSQPYEWWKGYGQMIDFTNPEAKQWWYTQLDKVFGENVCGWKVDQGEISLPDLFDTHAGRMSNKEYRHFYYDAMFDYTVSRKPSDGLIIARPFSHQGGLEASVEKMNMGWCGDFTGNWQGLSQQIDNMYRSSQYGYGAIGTEVGGFFRRKSSKTQFVRYSQFGCMTACMINGGENGAFSNHLPWYHGKDVEDIYRWCVNWMKQLVPYKFSTVVEAHLKGGSLMQQTSLEEESHCLGTDLFTKAITSDDNTVHFHLPAEGQWIDYWTGERYAAGEHLSQVFPLDRFPLFIRSGAIIPMSITSPLGEAGRGPHLAGKRIFIIYPNGQTSRLLHLPVGDGVEYFDCQVSCDEQARRITLRSDQPAEWVFIVQGKKQKRLTASGTSVNVKY